MLRPTLIAALAAALLAWPAAAQVQPFPRSFRTQEIAANGATIHVRIGGNGPAVVLLHGYGETGLKIDKIDLVTHDIGNMVGYAFAAQYPDRVTKFVLMDAPLP